jgi:glycosyltransferase involved in cell wall biosynthesis/UDP:flavonoid glycosyltransferase YjiC (YdhE family)
MHVILSRGFAGSERAAAEACTALSQRHDVALVVREDHRNPAGASVLDAVASDIPVFLVPPRWDTRRRLERAIREWAPDVVHTHLRRGTRYVARIGAPAVHVCTLHLSINSPHYLRADGLLCISEWQLDTVPGDYRGRVFLVPNSLVSQPRLDRERVRELRAELGAGDDDFLVGGVGRLVRRKGFDLLIRAFERARIPNGRLVVVGDGSQRRRLERMAGEHIRLTGFRRDAKDLYQCFDVFVCPSSEEPFGRVIAEALDGGTPVIATDAQGPRDIASRYPIELVPRDDVEQLAAALRRVAMGGRRRIVTDLSEFSLERTAAQMEDAYRTLLEIKLGKEPSTVKIPAAPSTPTAAVEASASPTATSALGRDAATEALPPRDPRGRVAPRYLFAPVSGPGGAGELMRCLTIAHELAQAEPAADIRFLVSRTAVFREAVQFPIIDCDQSPTNSTPQVLAAIESFRPHVMVFDNSGRTGQLKAAKRSGARLVFSSRAPKLRWKAFRLKWMRLLDEHWMVFPTFVIGGLTRLERLKLDAFPNYTVRQFDTLFTPSETGARTAWLERHGLAPGGYVVFVPGGRGEGQRIAEPAEQRFCTTTGCRAVVLTGRRNLPDELGANPRLLPRIGPDEVQHLLGDAAMVVSNGGTTMVHTIAHGRPLLAVPLAGDQARRIRRAVRLGIAATAPPDAEAIAAAAAELWRDKERQAAMSRRMGELGIANGVGEAVTALRALAERSSQRLSPSPPPAV